MMAGRGDPAIPEDSRPWTDDLWCRVPHWGEGPGGAGTMAPPGVILVG